MSRVRVGFPRLSGPGRRQPNAGGAKRLLCLGVAGPAPKGTPTPFRREFPDATMRLFNRATPLNDPCSRPANELCSLHDMTLQEQYDDAMFDFSRGDFANAAAKLQAVLAADSAYFEAQLALGMTYYRLGDFPKAIAEGHKAEALRPKEQLVHTNLSLFYMKSGNLQTAEHHGLQARIAGWRAENAAAKTGEAPAAVDPELQMAKPKVPATQVKVVRMPDKFPDQPWKKNKPAPPSGTPPAAGAAGPA